MIERITFILKAYHFPLSLIKSAIINIRKVAHTYMQWWASYSRNAVSNYCILQKMCLANNRMHATKWLYISVTVLQRLANSGKIVIYLQIKYCEVRFYTKLQTDSEPVVNLSKLLKQPTQNSDSLTNQVSLIQILNWTNRLANCS